MGIAWKMNVSQMRIVYLAIAITALLGLAPLQFTASYATIAAAKAQIEPLKDKVQDLVVPGKLKQGQANGLKAKLDAAKLKMDQEKVIPAINIMQAFINQVDAFFKAGKLTETDANSLIKDAASDIDAVYIIEQLGGTPFDITEIDGVLSSEIVNLNLGAGQSVKSVLIRNALPDAQLNIIEFAPASPSTFNLGINVSEQVQGVAPPAGVDVAFSFDVNPSIPLSTEGAFAGTPKAIFEVDKASFSPTDLELFFFDPSTGQWVSLGSPTLLDETDTTFIMEGNLLHFSKYAVGKKPTGGGGVGSGGSGGGGGGPAYMLVDTMPPEIVSYSYQPTEPFSGSEVKVTARISDDIGVSKAYLFYFVTEQEPKSKELEKYNSEWYIGTIPVSDIATGHLMYWVFAKDFSGNTIQSSLQRIEVQEAPSLPETKATITNLPAHVLEAINSKPKFTQPVEKLEVISMNDGKEIKSYPDKIIIKNTGDRTAKNIRIMLSPEIAKSFKLSEPAIKSIEPNSNVTVSLELNGNPNRNMAGGIVGYNGKLMVMAEHLSPITLPVNIGTQESYYLSNYMDKVASMAENRYNKISLLNSILSKQQKTEYNYEVKTSNGNDVITNASDELVIKNLSNKELKNVRIYLSNAGQVFQLEQKNIQYLEPNGQVSIKLIPRIDSAKYSKDIKGELLIVPANDKPINIPIAIGGVDRKNGADEFEVRMEGNEMTTAFDRIYIKNTGERTIDSVKIMLTNNLDRIFALNQPSFRSIAPGEQAVVEVKYNVKDLKTFMQNYNGEINIVSEHHNMRSIPINIEWKKISSEHFLIYTRNSDSDIAKAKDVIEFLESNYQNVASRFGEMKQKTKIYLTSTLEEFRAIAGSESYYAFSDDVIFICSCSDDVNSLAMKEFVYRITFNKYPNYANKEKFMFDGENWLMDGIANYIAANTTNEKEMVKSQLESFKEKPASFVWYGSGSPGQYGAAYTFFEYLHEKYGEKVIDKTLYYLGSGMISNTRCDTLEDCAMLRAVYDVSGLDIKKKRYTLDVDTLVKEWEDYIMEHYNVSIPKQVQK